MGCGESKHAVATANTLTKTKSKNMEIKNEKTTNEAPDVIKLDKEELFRKLDEREQLGGVRGVVQLDDHKNNGESDVAVVAAEEKVKDEIKNEESSKPDKAIVLDEAPGQSENQKDSPIVQPENNSLVVSEKKSEPENNSPVVPEEKLENDSLVVVPEEKSEPEDNSPVVPEEKLENNSLAVVPEEKSEPENDSLVAVTEEKSEPKNDSPVVPEEKENKALEQEDVTNKEKEIVEAAVEETKSSAASDQNDDDKAAVAAAADEKAN